MNWSFLLGLVWVLQSLSLVLCTVWAMDRQVRATAGALVLTGILASTVVPRAKWLAGGIGAGLLYSGVSDTCAMANLLSRAPWNRKGTPSLAQARRVLASR